VTPRTKLALIGAGLAAATATILYVLVPEGQQPTISGSTPANVVHNLNYGQPCPPAGSAACVYSGEFIVHTQSYGLYAINTTKATWAINASGGMQTGVIHKLPNQQSAWIANCNGDFYQSSQHVVASAGAAKWAVSTIPNVAQSGGCTSASGLGTDGAPATAVYSLSSGGNLAERGWLVPGGYGGIIEGDTLYLDTGDGMWLPVDLNSCNPSCAAQPKVGTLPAHTKQLDINGYTYTIAGIDQTHFTATRQGGALPPTPTAAAPPVTVPPASSHPYADYIEGIYQDGITGGCGANVFCPDNPLTRGQAAVWIWRAKHGAQAPPKCVPGRFTDVPCLSTP
jgi:hypothetical protein